MAPQGDGILSELQGSNSAKDRKKLVLRKLWRTQPENDELRWSVLLPSDHAAVQLNMEDGDSANSEGGGDRDHSGSSTPVMMGVDHPADYTAGQTGQTGQTGQQSRQVVEESPDVSPHGVDALKLEGEEEEEEPPEEIDPVQEFEGGCPGSAETKYAVFMFMEDPDTIPAHLFSALIMFVIVFSVMTMVVESLPQYAYNESDGEENKDAIQVFFIMETICIIIFTLEYSVRLYCVPRKLPYMLQPMNIVDLAAIAPYYITIILAAVVDVSSLKILRLLRIIRVFRVLKLAKYNRSLTVAIQALTDSTDMFGLMIFMLVVLCILFASFEYNFEMDDNPLFVSIPAAMWWCIVTVMMVGYGDMFPVTVAGKFIASGCIVIGILIMALPISVIGSNFTRTWERYEAKQREAKRALEAQRVLTEKESEELEEEKLKEIMAQTEKSAELLATFARCCGEQVTRIRDTETSVFEKGREIWERFAIDVKRITPAVELWRERAVREACSEEEGLMASLAENNVVLSKVLDAELDEQLARTIVNAQWMRLLVKKAAIVSQDVQDIHSHLYGEPHAMVFPEIIPSLEAARADSSEASQSEQTGGRTSTPHPGTVSRGRTPSPPPQGATIRQSPSISKD